MARFDLWCTQPARHRFLSAGLINIFIPSGGAQWALQGPSFIEAAKHFGNDLGLISMAVAYGDQWTNLIQPFTAIPILALSGLRLRHLLSFSALICLVQPRRYSACS